MNEESGVEYMVAWDLRQQIDGLGGVGVVEESSHPQLTSGDLVTCTFPWPWANYFAMHGSCLKKVRMSA
jgi:NADPH-dependent curcumin reductase CurA